jgi:hypothetical protein
VSDRYVIENTVGGYKGAAELREALQRIPRQLQGRTRTALRTAAAPIVTDAKRRASWSSRIPGSISSRVRFAGNKAGVRITVSARRAEHARPYEGLMARARDGRRAGFSHPVFAKGGNRRNWTWRFTQFRPFLAPAVEAGSPGVERSLLAAVDDVLRRNGF